MKAAERVVVPGIPEPASYKPANGALNVLLSDTLFITFDQAVTLLNPDSLRLARIGVNEAVSGTLTLVDSTLQFIPDTLFAESTYVLTLKPGLVQNSLFEQSPESNISLSTAPAPLVVSVRPADSAEGVLSSDSVFVKFNRPFSLSNADSIRLLHIEQDIVTTGTFITRDSTLIFVPTTLLPGGTYELKILRGLVASEFQVLNEPFKSTFKTAERPSVLRTSPPDQAEKVSADAVISFTMNEPVTEGNLSGISLTNLDNAALLDVNVSLQDSTVTIDHELLDNSARYSVEVPENSVLSALAIGNEGFSWTFTTIMSKPVVSTFSPTDNADNVSLLPVIKVKWSQPVVLKNGLSFKLSESGGAAVTGLTIDLALLETDSLVSITTGALTPATEYIFTVEAGAVENADGVANDISSMSFTTGGIGPAPLSLFPLNNQARVSVSSPVSIKFDQKIKAGNLAGVVIRNESGVALTGVSASVEDSTLRIFHPVFENSVRYTVLVASDAVTSVGGATGSQVSWSFTTILAEPAAISRFPENDAVFVPVDTRIFLVFNQPVTLFSNAGFSIKTARGINAEISSITVSVDTLIMTVPALLNNERYLVSVPAEAVMNVDSVKNSPVDWGFTTIKGPPVLSRAEPSANAFNIPVNAGFQFTFNENVTISNGTLVSVEDNAGVPHTGITVSSGDLNRVDVSMTDLSFLTTYTVVFGKGALRNNQLIENQEIRHSFTTIIEAPAVFSLISPVNQDSLVSTNASFSWNRSPRADHYHWQLSNSVTFDNILQERIELTDSVVSVPTELEPFTRYFWRVRATNAGGESGWSQIRAFVTRTPAPVPAFPADNEPAVSIAPVFSWQSEATAVRYRFQLSRQPAFNTIIADTNTALSQIQRYGLLSGTVYFWRVRVEDSRGKSEWSEPRTFTTRLSPEQVEAANASYVFDFGTSSSGTAKPVRSDFKLITLPGANNLKLDSVFTGAYNKTWRAFLETGIETEDYVEFKSTDERFRFQPGKGFWVLGTQIFELNRTLNGVPVTSADRRAIALQPGWNIIGTPFQKEVSWALVQRENQISGSILGFEKTFNPTDVMEPFKGYYYYNEPAAPKDSLYIPYFSEQSAGIPGLANGSQDPRLPRIAIKTKFNNGVETSAQIFLVDGTHSGALKTEYLPKEAFSAMHLSIAGEAGESPAFKTFKTFSGEDSLSVKFVIGGPVGTRASLLVSMTELPGLRCLLLHPLTGRIFEPAVSGEFDIVISEPQMKLTLLLGKEDQLAAWKTSKQPEETALFPAYPNPANPVSSVRFQLAQAKRVQLYLYDVNGRKVMTLIDNKEMNPGSHALTLDLSRLSSGLYLARMVAGNRQFTQKIVLLK